MSWAKPGQQNAGLGKIRLPCQAKNPPHPKTKRLCLLIPCLNKKTHDAIDTLKRMPEAIMRDVATVERCEGPGATAGPIRAAD